MAKLLIRLAKLDMSDRVFFWMYGLGSGVFVAATILVPLLWFRQLGGPFFSGLRRLAFGS